MDHLPGISLSPKTDSLPISHDSTSRLQQNYAAERARILFGCYRKGDANDPEVYTAAITAILAEYSAEVIQLVTDPRTGIPRKMKFMPNPAEVAEECDSAKKFLASEKVLKEKGYVWTGERYEKTA
jgi:hypothetical protein